MNIPKEEFFKLKKELDQILIALDKKYSEQIKGMYLTLFIIIPIIVLGVIFSLYENYFSGIGCYMVAIIILVSTLLMHLNARYLWKKERENAIWVFNVKLLQISIQHSMTLNLSESADKETDSTNRHR